MSHQQHAFSCRFFCADRFMANLPVCVFYCRKPFFLGNCGNIFCCKQRKTLFALIKYSGGNIGSSVFIHAYGAHCVKAKLFQAFDIHCGEHAAAAGMRVNTAQT